MEKQKLELIIRIEIRQTPYSGSGSGIQLSEMIELPERSFLEMCQVLAKFQELADTFRKEHR